LKSIGFLDKLSYESKERTELRRDDDHKAVCNQLCKIYFIILNPFVN